MSPGTSFSAPLNFRGLLWAQNCQCVISRPPDPLPQECLNETLGTWCSECANPLPPPAPGWSVDRSVALCTRRVTSQDREHEVLFSLCWSCTAQECPGTGPGHLRLASGPCVSPREPWAGVVPPGSVRAALSPLNHSLAVHLLGRGCCAWEVVSWRGTGK